MFHPSVVVHTTYHTAAGPRLFPNAIKAVGNGTWQCSTCSKNSAAESTEGGGGSGGSTAAAAAAAHGSQIEVDAVDSAAILTEASALLAKLPAVHWGSIVGSRLAALTELEGQYSKLCGTGAAVPGMAQLADLEDVQMRYKMVLDTHELDAGRSNGSVADQDVATSPDQPPAPPPNLFSLGAEFFKQGLVVPPAKSKLCMDPARAGLARDLVLQQYNENMLTINRLGLMDQLQDTGFRTFKPRGPKRFDIQIPALDHIEEFCDKAPWLPLVRSILGADFKRMSASCVLSLPESPGQKWHSDGDHMSTIHQLPTHCLNVFVPLCDMTPVLGQFFFRQSPFTEVNLINYFIPKLILMTPALGPLFFEYWGGGLHQRPPPRSHSAIQFMLTCACV